MPRKTVILDASSAILLCKSGLHDLLTETYDLVLSESVFREITANPYAGSAEYKQLAAEGVIRILANQDQQKTPGNMIGLDAGEGDTIRLYLSGIGYFIITDDGPAARYCNKQGIPFINALLFPAVLMFAHRKDAHFCRRAMEKIIATGRYSPKVIAFARRCRRETIAFALP